MDEETKENLSSLMDSITRLQNQLSSCLSRQSEFLQQLAELKAAQAKLEDQVRSLG